ncbi:MAG: hypothetical protein LBP71_01540 [Spirochaetaceae bacterium]|jgi:hypothetical protein|nr:hypothetical protein [Spirochaetaceae bacterium]
MIAFLLLNTLFSSVCNLFWDDILSDDFLSCFQGCFIDRNAAGIAMDERPVTYPAFAYFEPFRNLPERKDALARSLNQTFTSLDNHRQK